MKTRVILSLSILATFLISFLGWPTPASAATVKVYDFSANAGIDKWAYFHEAQGYTFDTASLTPSLGTEVELHRVLGSGYAGIAQEDGVYFHVFRLSTKQVRFVYQIQEPETSITELRASVRLYCKYDTAHTVYLWNASESQWEPLASLRFPQSNYYTLAGTITDSISDYVDSDGRVYVVACQEGLGVTSSLSVDYAYLRVSSSTPPTARDDGYSLLEETSLICGAPGVLGNDSLGDGDSLTAHLVSQAEHGVVDLGNDGSFTYTPDTGFTGEDSFTYRVNDGVLDSNIATVTITVSPLPPPAADFSASETSGLAPLTSQFTDESAGDISFHQWDFNEDGVVDSNEQNPLYTYEYTGTYAVSLTVSGPGGTDAETKSAFITVVTPSEQPVLDSPASPESGEASPTTITSPDEGSDIDTLGCDVSLRFPPESTHSESSVVISKLTSDDVPPAPSGYLPGATCFRVEMEGELPPDEEVDICVDYSEEDLRAAGGDPHKLVLSYYDEDTGEWVPVETTVDPISHTLTATTNHFSNWMVIAQETSPSADASGFPLWGWALAALAGIVMVMATPAGIKHVRNGGRHSQFATQAGVVGADTLSELKVIFGGNTSGTLPRPPRSEVDTLPTIDITADGDSLRPSSFPAELEALYADVEEIGGGGYAMVFRARRASDGKEVAVKVPKGLTPVAGKNFLQEVLSWHRLSHTNIAELYDLNVTPVPYLEMELCQSDLDQLPTPLDTHEAVRLVLQISEGLQHAHSQGIVHGDLKPQNLLLKDGVAKITDWNMSKLASASKQTACNGFSPRYAAPEQLSPEEFGSVDHRTDIYQLGVVLYELVAGEPLFTYNDVAEFLAHIRNSEPVLKPEAEPVEHIILKCLSKNMRDRYQSIQELHQDLVQYMGSGSR